jgi:hypothetical protein
VADQAATRTRSRSHGLAARSSIMITEDFWVYVSGMFRDHGGPGGGSGRRHVIRLPILITDDFWVYVSGMFRDHGGAVGGGH